MSRSASCKLSFISCTRGGPHPSIPSIPSIPGLISIPPASCRTEFAPCLFHQATVLNCAQLPTRDRQRDNTKSSEIFPASGTSSLDPDKTGQSSVLMDHGWRHCCLWREARNCSSGYSTVTGCSFLPQFPVQLFALISSADGWGEEFSSIKHPPVSALLHQRSICQQRSSCSFLWHRFRFLSVLPPQHYEVGDPNPSKDLQLAES